jgi:hypothetical protein
MTLTTRALALYQRTRAQYRHLTASPQLPADHTHLTRQLTLTFPLHRPPTRPHRRPRPLATALRHLLAALTPPPPSPSPPAPPAVPPISLQRPCRMCAATVHRR